MSQVSELIERLRKRAAEDRECAANSQVVADLLKPQLELFNVRQNDKPWNTYAVRMAVDHNNSVRRDTRYAKDLEAAIALLEKVETA